MKLLVGLILSVLMSSAAFAKGDANCNSNGRATGKVVDPKAPPRPSWASTMNSQSKEKSGPAPIKGIDSKRKPSKT
jgi:hypothetical protein